MLGFSPLAASPLAATADGSVSVSVNATGVSATSGLGSVSVNLVLEVNVTGVSGTGAVGDVSLTGGARVELVSTGWGRGGWGDLAFGEGDVSLTGTTALGSVTVAIGIDADATGLSATGAVGDVSVSPQTNVTVTGVQSTASVGSATVNADANVSATWRCHSYSWRRNCGGRRKCQCDRR